MAILNERRVDPHGIEVRPFVGLHEKSATVLKNLRVYLDYAAYL